MPTYQYKCQKCHQSCEIFQKITDDPILKCSSCNENALKRIISGASAYFQFKGSGFYITDYKNKQKSSSENNQDKSSDKPS